MKSKSKLRLLCRFFFSLVILSVFYILGLLMIEPVFWYLFYFTTILLVISLLIVLHSFFALKLSGSHGLIFNEAERVTVIFQLKKMVSLAFIQGWVKLGSKYYPLIKAKEGYVLKQETSLQRGIYQNTKLLFMISDWFAIFWWQKELPLQEVVTVLPRYLPEESQKLWQKLITKISLTTPLSLPNQEIKNIRNYQTGDHYRQIDWKLSAKGEGLVVKEFEPESEIKFKFIFLGMEGSSNEKLLALFYSFFSDYNNLLGRENFYLAGNNQFRRAPDNLAFANFNRKQNFKLNLAFLEQEGYGQEHFILFVPKVTDVVVSTLYPFHAKNNVTLIYYLENQLFVDELVNLKGEGGLDEH